MSHFEDRLRAGLHALVDDVDPPPSLRAAVAARLAPAPRPARRPARRPLTVAAAVALPVVVLGSLAAVLLARSGDDRSVGRPPATTVAPVTGPGGWRPMAGGAGPARQHAQGVWTGAHLVVWGGFQGQVETGPDGERFRAEHLTAPIYGARYDAYGDVWLPTEAAPIAGRADHVMVWTGREVVVHGGAAVDLFARPYGGTPDGAAYDPVADRWRLIAPAPPGAPTRGRGVWTGTEVVAVDRAGAAAAYDPAADTWRLLARAPVAEGTFSLRVLAAVWTGTEVLVLLDGRLLAYDPAADAWRALPDPPVEVDDPDQVAWTGTRLVAVAAGTAGAAAYDPAAGAWRALPAPPVGPHHPHLAWTGDRLLVWSGGGTADGTVATDSFAYDPATDQWAALPPSPLTASPAVVAWTGERLLVWREMYGGGARYLPDV